MYVVKLEQDGAIVGIFRADTGQVVKRVSVNPRATSAQAVGDTVSITREDGKVEIREGTTGQILRVV